jgi:hypothetical protein
MNGLQPVPFGKFINLLASARQQMQTLPTTGGQYGFAGGGAVPVAGRQVLGPGGPRDDAIPAVIDGTQPAALSNGEFVMPTDVTQYWGTAKLQQMIDKARGQ